MMYSSIFSYLICSVATDATAMSNLKRLGLSVLSNKVGHVFLKEVSHNLVCLKADMVPYHQAWALVSDCRVLVYCRTRTA